MTGRASSPDAPPLDTVDGQSRFVHRHRVELGQREPVGPRANDFESPHRRGGCGDHLRLLGSAVDGYALRPSGPLSGRQQAQRLKA